MIGLVMKNTIIDILTISIFSICLVLLGISEIAFAEDPPENILKNGDFDSQLDQWHHWTHENATANFS